MLGVEVGIRREWMLRRKKGGMPWPVLARWVLPA